MVTYDLFLFRLKIETSTRGTNSMPIWRSFNGLAIICGCGLVAVLYSSKLRFIGWWHGHVYNHFSEVQKL